MCFFFPYIKKEEKTEFFVNTMLLWYSGKKSARVMAYLALHQYAKNQSF